MRIRKKILFVIGAVTLITVAVLGSGSDQVSSRNLADPHAAGASAPHPLGAEREPWGSKIDNDGGTVAPNGSNGDRAGQENGKNKSETSNGEKSTESGRKTADIKYGPITDRLISRTHHTTGKHVALTFDDGPHPVWTPPILRLLRQHHVKATFCVLGERAEANPELIRQIVADGHTLCDHTMTHDANLPESAETIQVTEIDGALRAIHKAAPGAPVPYYRAPEGTFSQPIQTLVASMGMRSLFWSIDTLDWTKPGAAAIVRSVRDAISVGDVVLMHDGGGDRSETVQALEQLLPWLVAEGYRFELPS